MVSQNTALRARVFQFFILHSYFFIRMKRGGYGKPWRPPADGWSVPPKIFFGGLYQHVRPALNNLPRYQNNTQVTLQQNQVGSPVTRINPAALVANCGVTDTSGLPEIPWIGVGANQFLPP